jgi:hypothetical protein
MPPSDQKPFSRTTQWILGLTGVLTAVIGLLAAVGDLPGKAKKACEDVNVCATPADVSPAVNRLPDKHPAPTPPPQPSESAFQPTLPYQPQQRPLQTPQGDLEAVVNACNQGNQGACIAVVNACDNPGNQACNETPKALANLCYLGNQNACTSLLVAVKSQCQNGSMNACNIVKRLSDMGFR